MIGRRTAFALAIVALIDGPWSPSVVAQRVSEYEVKAAYLQNFARFVEWPASVTDDEFRLCILGDDPFGRLIDEATAGTRVKTKPVVVRRIRQVEDASGCHTVFISASEETRVRVVLDGLRLAAVLTVSDVPQFADRGGMIGFTTAGGRVRFTANPGVARAAGLQLSSELLRVAASVVGQPPKE